MTPSVRKPQPKADLAALPTNAGTDAQAFAIAAGRIAHDLQSSDVVVIDLRGLSTLADYFVIATSRSDRQARAVLDTLHDFARSVRRSPLTTPDRATAAWMLADYVDVVVHLFDPDHRSYYDLDGLWGDAPRVAWEAPTQGA